MTPGPSVLLADALKAERTVNFHHRGDEFRAMMHQCQLGLRNLLGLKDKDVPIVLTASGTGAMEAAFLNALSPNDTIAVLHAGRYGERWMDLAREHNITTLEFSAVYGSTFDLKAIEESISKGPSLSAVFFQDNESSTGTRHDTRKIIELIKRHHPNALIVVDGMTGVGVHPLSLDLGIDVLITGSQKSLGIHPGLSFLGLSQRFVASLDQPRLPRVYFDLRREVEAQARGVTSWTPAIGLFAALEISLKKIDEIGGRSVLIKNATTLAEALRHAVNLWGLPLLSQSPGNGVTAISLDRSREVIHDLRQHEHLVVASGQGSLEGKIIRVGHLGFISASDMMQTIKSMEQAFARQRITIRQSAIEAAESILSRAPQLS